MNGNYRALLARADARQLLTGLGLAWLSFGMVALAIFLTVHRADGSYALAGAAVAAFSVGSGALAPLRGRLLDRRGARPWLFLFAAAYALALLALATLAHNGSSGWALVALAAASGASAPPLVATSRALWPTLVGEALLRRAYALTAIVGDVGTVVAPALGGLLFVEVSWLPLVVCATCAVAAAVAVSRVARRRPEPPPEVAGARSLRTRSFAVLVGVEVALGAALGLVEVAVPTAATSWGETAYAGLLLAAFALGSVVGGIWFGRRRWQAPAERRYLLAALVLAVTLLPPIAATSAAGLAPLLIIAGLSFGPATISLFEALDTIAATRATEAFTWITTSAAAGTAVGSAAAGWLTSSVGLGAAFAVAAGVLGAAAAVGLVVR